MQSFKVIFFSLLSFSLNGQMNLNRFYGTVPESIFLDKSNEVPDCKFVDLYNPTSFKGSVKIGLEETHVMGRSLIQGCESYSLLWQAPSEITAFDEHKKDSLYFSTRYDGLYFFEQGLMKKISLLGSDLPNEIRKIRFLNDQLFILGNQELVQLDLNDLVASTFIGSPQRIDDFEVDPFKQIWVKIGSEVFYNDQYLEPSSVNFSVMKMDDSSRFSVLTEATKLEPGVNVFKVGSNFKGSQKAIEYQYKLNNQDWVSSSDPILPIQGIKEGDNELVFRMSIDETFAPAKLFKLTKKATDNENKLWKYLIGFLLALVGLLAFAFNRERNMKQTVMQRISRVRAERQLEKTEQKVLQLEMNPHFLFNALNNIKGLIATGKSKEARMYLSKFGSIMRTVLNYSKEENITLEQEVEFLQNYLAIEQMANPEQFDFEIEISSDLDMQKRIPGMIIQPIVENAIIHGIGPMTKKGQISIRFYRSDEHLFCTVIDNGVGIKAKQEKQSAHKSYAMQIINERLNHAGIKESLKIIDLKEEKGNVTGTKVVIKIG